jgi:branched-chain amino acid aminotransferase
MPNLVYFNGLLRTEEEVNLTPLDRSYLYGEGLFETMRATEGFIPFLDEHLTRLFRGMDLLNMKLNLSGAKLEFALYQTLHHNRLKNAYLRLTLSRENEAIGSIETSENTNLVVVAKPLPRIPQKIYDEGCSAMVSEEYKIAPDRLCQIKSTNYLRQLLAQREAREAGADEALMVNTYGRLVEGASSNLFLFDGKKFLTPPLEEGILPGITRQVVIDLLVKNRFSYEERPIDLAELWKMEEVFLTNSIKEIFPLTHANQKKIGSGKVGPQTQKMMQLFKEEVQFRLENFESRRWGVQDMG